MEPTNIATPKVTMAHIHGSWYEVQELGTRQKLGYIDYLYSTSMTSNRWTAFDLNDRVLATGLPSDVAAAHAVAAEEAAIRATIAEYGSTYEGDPKQQQFRVVR